MTAQGLPATTSVAEWTRALRHVEANVRSGRYVNAETTLLVAGPPRVSDIGGLNNADTFAARNFQGGTNSDVLGVTESRVSQLHTKAVLGMRSHLQNAAA